MVACAAGNLSKGEAEESGPLYFFFCSQNLAYVVRPVKGNVAEKNIIWKNKRERKE